MGMDPKQERVLEEGTESPEDRPRDTGADERERAGKMGGQSSGRNEQDGLDEGPRPKGSAPVSTERAMDDMRREGGASSGKRE